MNSAKSFITLRQKVESSLKRHWASVVYNWNVENAGKSTELPVPELWEINVGTIDGANVDSAPTLQVSLGSSTFRNLTTCTREETFRLTCVVTIPDSTRGKPQSLELAGAASRLATEILERNAIDSPGDENGVTYKAEIQNSTPFSISEQNQRGAAYRVEILLSVISNYEYQPDIIVTQQSPTTYRANLADRITAEFFSLLTPVEEVTGIVSGSVTVVTLAACDALTITTSDPMTPMSITTANAWSTAYLISQQALTVSVAAGTATITISDFDNLEPGDVYSVRIWAWDDVSQNEIFCTLNLVKS